MKKLIALLAVLILSLVVFQSCTKNSSKDFPPPVASGATPDRIIMAKVTPGQAFTVSIDNAGELNISRQASNFKISQTGIDPKTGSLTYSYLSSDGFKGTDEVILAHKTEYIYSSNSSCGFGSNSAIGSRTSYIAVRLTVAD
ncbi:MAG: hypothetical protein ABI675_27455 [Chitinophagaceae bacterium]